MFDRFTRSIVSYGKRGKVSTEIDPDEVLLDSHNLPEFNQSQFEGRIETPIYASKLTVLFGVFLLIALVFAGRLWFLQIYKGEVYAAQSEENRLGYSIVFAERGILYDRNNVELAWNVPAIGEDLGSFSSRAFIDEPGFAHLLGYVTLPRRDKQGYFHRTEIEGVVGAEKIFNAELTGTNGLKIVETNALGQIQSESSLAPPVEGSSVALSIDSRLQAALHEFITERSNSDTFIAGSGVIMDIHTGEILALTNYPEFDPKALTDGDEDKIAEFQADDRQVFLNRAIAGLYTPGSIVKPIVALGALQEEIIDPKKKILSTGQLVIPNPYTPSQPSIFRDWRAHGLVDMRRGIAVSSNVYIWTIGGGFGDQEGLGITRLEKYFRLFGLGSVSGIEFEGEEEGVIPNPTWKEETFGESDWRIGDTYNTAIGQYGFLIPPIQAVRAIGAIATNGKLLTPSIKKGGSGQAERLLIDEDYYEVAHDGMRGAVLEGTAQALNFPWITIAGKTGTAEVGRNKQFMNSWVVGFFPYEEPKYAFAVVMERAPAGTLQGSPYVMYQMMRWMKDNTPEYFDITPEM